MEYSNSFNKEEWIDGRRLMSPRPRINHMNTLSELTLQFNEYFRDSKCKARQEYALFLTKDNIDDVLSSKSKLRKILTSKKAEVVPDLIVYCDEKQEFYRGIIGIPQIIVEVLSPSNSDDDTVEKFELYKSYGVPEYWIISPMSKIIKIFRLTSKGEYKEVVRKSYEETVESNLFNGLRVNLSKVRLINEPEW